MSSSTLTWLKRAREPSLVDLRKLATLRERFEWLVSIWSVYTRSRTPDATSLGNVPEITRCLFNPLLPSIALHHDGTDSC